MPTPLPHRIERTRNRHSRAVYRDDTIVIRLARNLTMAEEREHIEFLLRRMAAKVSRERERSAIDPFRTLLEGAALHTVMPADGRPRTFLLTPGNRTKAKHHGDAWHVSVGPAIRKEALHRFLWRLLCRDVQHATAELVHRVNVETFQVPIRSVRLCFASSQWGSCSAHGDIMLNAVLLFVRPPLLRYVIIHELAHRLVRNHSPRYWRAVEGVLPDWRELRRELHALRICSL